MASGRRKTHEEFVKELKNINPNISPCGSYVNLKEKMSFTCNICGHSWKSKPYNILKSGKCPNCNNTQRLKKYTKKEFVEFMKDVNPSITILGKYVNNKTGIECECKVCGHIWHPTPTSLRRGTGCPRCAKNGNSYMQKFIYYSLTQVFDSVLYRDRKTIGVELDLIIPSIKTAIEPGSWFWHKNKTDVDIIKQQKCEALGYKCITFYDAYPDSNKPYENCIVYNENLGQNEKALKRVIIEDLLPMCGKENVVIDWDKVKRDMAFEKAVAGNYTPPGTMLTCTRCNNEFKLNRKAANYFEIISGNNCECSKCFRKTRRKRLKEEKYINAKNTLR